MLHYRLYGLLLLGAVASMGCKESSSANDGGGSTGGMAGGSSVEEVRKGERGSSCDSTNDCQEGLSCIVTGGCPAGVACANKSCQPSNFDILGTGKQCHLTECTTKADCCGDLPEELPAKCADRDVKCSQPTVPGCLVTTCLDDSYCNGGTCGGTCSRDGATCLTSDDCEQDSCDLDTGTCRVGLNNCNSDDECQLVNTCSTPYCNCTNPAYDPTDAICSDPDCQGVCGWTCAGERCVVDTSCKADTDCAYPTPHCGDDGTCVECLTSDDCEDAECVGGRCGPECEHDTQCGVFEACQEEKCVFVGCRTDRECVLGAGTGLFDPAQDPRLAVCSIEQGVGTCVYPCEIDAQCSPTEVCLDGRCEYIGCETDAECKTIAGLHNHPLPTRDRPWTTSAVCREEATTP